MNKNIFQYEILSKIASYDKDKKEIDTLFYEIENILTPKLIKIKNSIAIWNKYKRTIKYFNFFISIYIIIILISKFNYIYSLPLMITYNIIFTIISKNNSKHSYEKNYKFEKNIWDEVNKRNILIHNINLIKDDLRKYILEHSTDLPIDISNNIKNIFSLFEFKKTKIEIDSEKKAYETFYQLQKEETRTLEKEFLITLNKLLNK